MDVPIIPGGSITLNSGNGHNHTDISAHPVFLCSSEQLASLISKIQESVSIGSESTSNSSNKASLTPSVPNRDQILIVQPKGEVGRSGTGNRPGYSLLDASRLSPSRYKMLYNTVTVHLYKHCDVMRKFKEQDSTHLTAVRLAVKKVHPWLWRYPKTWIIDKMMVQLLTTSTEDDNFEDWGEENLLLAVERGVTYVEDPPDWSPKRPKKKAGSEDGSAQDATAGVLGDVAEDEGDPKQFKGQKGRRKGKAQATKVPEKAAPLVVDEEDEDEVALEIGGGAQQESAAEARGGRRIAPASNLKGKSKEPIGNSNAINLSDSDESPFSTHESGSSDEDEDDEDDEGPGATNGGTKVRSIITPLLLTFLSMFWSLTSPAIAPCSVSLLAIPQQSRTSAPAPTQTHVPAKSSAHLETPAISERPIEAIAVETGIRTVKVNASNPPGKAVKTKAVVGAKKPGAPSKVKAAINGKTAKHGRDELGVVEDSEAKRPRRVAPSCKAKQT